MNKLIKKYERKRARFYREGGKAQKRHDMEGQLIYTAFQLAYTEMQSDLERLVEALERITEWSVATQDKRYKLEMKWLGTPVYDAPNRIASDALAKAKEKP